MAYLLAVTSHKGGTGQTTSAAALAWAFAESGISTALADADPVDAIELVAPTNASGRWGKVLRCRKFEPLPSKWPAVDLMVVDAPPLTELDCQSILAVSHGMVLTILSDPLSLRTTQSATAAIRVGRQANARLQLLGMLVSRFQANDELERQVHDRLRQSFAGLVLDPAVPSDPALSNWALKPGDQPPSGPGRDAYRSLAKRISPHLMDVPSGVGVS